MGERSKERGLPPQLLNLIPDEREWKVKGAGGGSRGISFDAEEDNKLELKLGLPVPGVQQDQGAAGSREQKIHQKQLQAESCSELSLGCFPAHSSKLPNTGAKRGFFDTVVAKPEGCSLQDTEGCGNELTELRLGGENMSGERKKGCCPPPSHGSAAAAAPVHNSSSSSPQGRAAVLPAVGWPPVRSFRRNLAHGSSSKQSPERQNNEDDGKAKLICKKSPLVKINMDGIPIGRKLDLLAYDSYQKLSSAIEELFRGFLEAQKDLSCAESGEQGAEVKLFSGLLDGTGEYALVYEDNEGNRMLIRDIPWSAFISTAKRLRVMRRSELPRGLIGAVSGRVADC